MNPAKHLLCAFCLAAPLSAQQAPMQTNDMQMDHMQMDHMQMHNMQMAHPQPLQLPTPELLQSLTAQPPLKLEDFLTLADKNNPTLQQAAATIRRSQALATQAALYPNPTLGYEGDQIRGGSYHGGEQGAFLAQTIVLGGKLSLRKNIYQQQQQSDTLAAEAQQQRVHSDITRLYYAAVSAEQLVLVRGRLLALASQAVETAHHSANVGQADTPDILQSEVEQEQARIDYTLAQRMFLQSFRSLAIAAGTPAQPLTHLDATLDNPPAIDTAAVVDTITEQSPTVRQARQLVTLAEVKLKAARREVIPDLQLKAGEQENREALPNGKQTGPQSFASAAIEVPLWNRNQGNVAAAQAELDHARLEVTRAQLTLRQQAEQRLQDYLSAKLESDQYRTALLPRARRAYQLYLENYQAMAQAYPQVILSQRTLFQLEARSLDAQARVWQTATALQYFMLQGALDLSPVKGN